MAAGRGLFPLTVDVERMYAAGKIPGGFFKREGRATERATLTARMIDRPIRPSGRRASRTRCRSSAPCCRPTWSAARHPRDQRGVRGPRDLADAVPRAGGRGSRGVIDGQRWSIRPSRSSRTRPSISSSSAAERTDDHRGRGDQVPEETMLEASSSRTARSSAISDVIEELAREVGKPKWIRYRAEC